MTNEEILKFQKRARYVARKYRYLQLADDFAQEVILKFLENPDRSSTVDQLFIDYLRGTFGDHRNDLGLAKSKAYFNSCSLNDARNIQSGPSPRPESERSAFLFGGLQGYLYQAYFVNELTEEVIGETLGVTGSRVSQLIASMKKMIQDQAILEEGLSRLEGDPKFLTVKIDWITI